MSLKYMVRASDRWLSVLAYNIQQPILGGILHQILGTYTEKSFLSTEVLPEVLEKIGDIDVIVFTESFIKSLRNRLLKLMSEKGYYWFTPVVNCDTRKHCNGGVIIVSKYPIIKVRHYEYKAASNVDGLAAKGVIYAIIKKHGYRYHILGTHLNAFYDNEDTAKVARRWQILEMRKFCNSLKIPRTEPVIIAGDLNIDYGSHEHKVMLTLLKANQPPIYGNKSLDIVDNEWALGGLKSCHLDYILYSSRHLQPVKTVNRVLPIKWHGRDLSDHYPVLGLFKFN